MFVLPVRLDGDEVWRLRPWVGDGAKLAKSTVSAHGPTATRKSKATSVSLVFHELFVKFRLVLFKLCTCSESHCSVQVSLSPVACVFALSVLSQMKGCEFPLFFRTTEEKYVNRTRFEIKNQQGKAASVVGLPHDF